MSGPASVSPEQVAKVRDLIERLQAVTRDELAPDVASALFSMLWQTACNDQGRLPHYLSATCGLLDMLDLMASQAAPTTPGQHSGRGFH